MNTNDRFSKRFIPDPESFSLLRSSVKNPEKIKVTALVSTYNSARFFKACIEDLINQTLFARGELEILVVDSNSEQNEGETLLEYERSHGNITYLRTKNREPLYKAWNRAIVCALGSYVTSANTDDRHRFDALEKLAQSLDLHPECALAYADSIATVIENETYECCSVKEYLAYPDFDPIWQIHFGQCGPQPMWRKSLHETYGGFITGFEICSDYEWWTRLAQSQKFIHIPELLGLYLSSATSIEHRKPEKTQFETDTIRNFYAAKADIVLDNNKYPNRAIEQFYSRHSLVPKVDRLPCSIVVAKPRFSECLESVAALYEAAKQFRFEVILNGQPDCNVLETFGRFSSRLRIRAVPRAEGLPLALCNVLAALHASTSCIKFISSPSEINAERLLAVSERFERDECQLVVLEEDPNLIKDWTSIARRTVFSSKAIAPIRESSSISEAGALLDAICRKIEPTFGSIAS